MMHSYRKNFSLQSVADFLGVRPADEAGPALVVGAMYEFDHPTRGVFTARLLADDGARLDVELPDGCYARRSNGHYGPGDQFTIIRVTCTGIVKIEGGSA